MKVKKTVDKLKKISVIGLGYVGQTLAVTLAEAGFTVYGTDTDEDTLKRLKSGKSLIQEPNINDLIAKHLGKDLFIGTSQEIYTNNSIEAFIMCVSTPFDRLAGKPDSTAVENAASEVQGHLKHGLLVIMRSTLPIGATRGLVKPILERSGLRVGKDISLAFAPERTIEGNALQELRTLPQIIGGIDEESLSQASDIFKQIAPIIIPVSSLEAAEAIKLLDNSYRDVRFAYANEIAMYFENAGLNAFEIIRAANQGYPRNSIPVPSPGVGGACLSKDPYILISSAQSTSEKLEIVAKAREINEAIPQRIVARLRKEGQLANKNIFISGFAFKGQPETNDMRESPTVELVRLLKKENAHIFGYDPCVEDWKIKSLGIDYVSNLEDGIKGADIAIFMINHHSFLELDISQLARMMTPGGIIFDGWGLFDRKEIEALGLKYRGVGIG